MEMEARAVKGHNFTDKCRMLIFKASTSEDVEFLAALARVGTDGGTMTAQEKGDDKQPVTRKWSGI